MYTETGDKLLERVEYGNGGKVKYTYDGFKRVQGVGYDAATAPRFTYAYGANGQAASVRDNELNRTVITEYDGADRPRCVAQYEHAAGASTGQAKHRATLSYDERGNQDMVREEMPDGELNVTLKLFDADNRVEGVAYNYFDRDIGYEYDPYGRLITRAHRMAPGYGSIDRDGGPFDGCYLTSYFYQHVGDNDTTPLVTEVYQPGNWFEYTYDNVGNIASENRNNFLTTYGYDALGQLTRVNDEWEEYTWTYAYDRGGNIVNKAKYYYTEGAPGTPVETVAFTYGDANWKDKLTAYNGKAITYDAIGNPLTYDGWTYTWKAGRMLHSLVKSGTNAQFAYDHNGQRVKKTVNGVVTEYTLMGKDIVHLKKGADELHFYYDAQGKPGMMRYNGEYYYYLYNLQGDVIAIIDDYANAVAEYYYDAWGKQTGCYGVMSQTLGKLNPFRYRGYVYDEETGLYYLRSRYYNPEWGRFVNADRQFDANANNCSLNLFCYCANNPISNYDNNGSHLLNDIGQTFFQIWIQPWVTRADNAWNNTSFYNVGNYLTCGLFDTIKGAIAPEKPLSFQHWADSFTVVTLAMPAAQGISKMIPVKAPLPNNPLNNIIYTHKVMVQMSNPFDKGHAFPKIIDNYGGYGTQSLIKGGDGLFRVKVEIPGHYNGVRGTFEYIIEPTGFSNHRLFKPL